MYSCEGCLANFNRQGNLIQHLEKSTNLLCIDARQALRDKMRPVQGRRQELSDVDVKDPEDSEISDADSDMVNLDGGFVDLDMMPVEIDVEGYTVEAEANDLQDEDHDGEDNPNRTFTAPGGISIESHNRLEVPPVFIKKFGGQAGKPIRTNINGGYSNYVGQRETDGQENIWAPFSSKMEWEIVQWVKLHGPGSTSFTEFLEIKGVS